MKVSLDGVLLRMKGAKGLKFMVTELIRTYSDPKRAFRKGDYEPAKEFFDTWVVSGEKE